MNLLESFLELTSSRIYSQTLCPCASTRLKLINKIKLFFLRQPPLNQKFYRYIANMMCISTVGNRKMWGYATYPKMFIFINIVAIIFAPTIIVSEIAYLCVNFTKLDFEILTISFSIIPTTMLANVSIWNVVKKNNKTRLLFHQYQSRI